MPERFAFCENPRLNILRKANIAIAVSVDVHEHSTAHKERVLMDSGIWLFRHTGQREDSEA